MNGFHPSTATLYLAHFSFSSRKYYTVQSLTINGVIITESPCSIFLFLSKMNQAICRCDHPACNPVLCCVDKIFPSILRKIFRVQFHASRFMKRSIMRRKTSSEIFLPSILCNAGLRASETKARRNRFPAIRILIFSFAPKKFGLPGFIATPKNAALRAIF